LIMPNKKVLFVNHSMDFGGIETMVLDMARAMPSHGFDAEIAVFEAGGGLDRAVIEDGIRLHCLHQKPGLDWPMIFRLRELIRSGRIDVVHTHNFSAWLYGAIAARLTRDVIHVHTEHSVVDYSRARYAAERALSRLRSHVVAVSNHVRKEMADGIGIPSDRIGLLYNGVNLERFSEMLDCRNQVRAEIGVGQNEVLIGVVARLASIKNHAHLFRSAAHLLLRGSPPIRLLLAGDGPERQALEALAHDLQIAERVSFLGARKDTNRIFRALDIYVLPSLSEGMNLTLLEAMSSSLPVVATDVGGNSEIVLDGTTGFLVAVDDEAAMRARISQLVSDPGQRKQMGDAGRISVAMRFDQKATLAAYAALYRKRP
jgi:L-malate glycosyltransferase